MKKKFLTNLILIIFLNLLIKPLWIFGIDVTVQNIVGDEFGVYAPLLMFSFLLNIILDMGITNYNNRNISQNHQLLSKHFSNLVVLKVLLGVAYAIICLIVGLLLDYDARQFKILGLLVFNQFLISFALYLRSNVAGLQMHTTNSLLSILDKFLMIVFSAVLIWGNLFEKELQIEWFVYAQTAAYLTSTIICFFIVIAKSQAIRFKWDLKFCIVIIRQSLPYALLVLFMTFYTKSDSVIMEYLMRDHGGQSINSTYYHGYRIFDAAYQFAMLFGVLLLPMFSVMIKKKDSIKELLQLSFLLLIIPSLILALGSQIYRVEIMDQLYQGKGYESSRFIGILMFAFLGMALTIIFGSLLTANGSLRQLNWISGIAVVINISLNLILIPKYEAFGAAVACLVTQLFAGISQMILALKMFRISFHFSIWFRLLIFTTISLGIGIVSKELDFNWMINLSLMVCLSMLLAFLLRLIHVKAILILLKQKNV